MTNIFNKIANYSVILFSLSTATGVLLHDTGIDKAVLSAMHKTQKANIDSEPVRVRSGSNLHPHAEKLTVKKDVRNSDMMPRKRVSKQAVLQTEAKLGGCGFHNDGVCLPLAGEWV